MSHTAMTAQDRQGEVLRWRRRSRLIRTLRIALPALMALVVAGLAGGVIWRSATEQPVAREGQTVIRLVNAQFVGRVKDGRGFMIGARQAIRDEQDYQSVALIEPVMVVGEGAGSSRVSARAGNYNERDKLLRLRGDVRIDDGKGVSITTQEAIVDTQTGEVIGQSQVQGDGPLGQLSAKSYSVQDGGDRLVMKGGVSARIQPSKKD
ncbi:MAG TPA: LPS export ABC transporter periplasmic protein LptC [Caulobacteraceae bacterium]|nr:LPS export ABC transporter periplasmic protein LptC [Caulobacteraceae bacterium]